MRRPPALPVLITPAGSMVESDRRIRCSRKCDMARFNTTVLVYVQRSSTTCHTTRRSTFPRSDANYGSKP